MPTDAKKYAAVLTSLMNTTPEKGRPLLKQYNWFHKTKACKIRERKKEKKEKNNKEADVKKKKEKKINCKHCHVYIEKI